MKKIVYSLLVTVTAVVLLFSYKTSPDPAQPPTDNPVPPDPATPTTQTPRPTDHVQPTPTPTPTPSPTAPAGPADGLYTGASANTRYGPVQVQITVEGGVMTKSDAVVYPDRDPRDISINRVAIPILNDEAVAAQSAKIQMVTGATFTSRGYITSLQDALDQAGI